MAELVAQGKVRALGMSNVTAEHLRRAQAVRRRMAHTDEPREVCAGRSSWSISTPDERKVSLWTWPTALLCRPLWT